MRVSLEINVSHSRSYLRLLSDSLTQRQASKLFLFNPKFKILMYRL